MLKKIVKKLKTNSKNQTYPAQSSAKRIKLKKQNIQSNLTRTLATFKEIYNYPINKDITIRHVQIGGMNTRAALFFINSITNTSVIEDHVIRPLLLNDESREIADMISAQSITEKQQIGELLTEINNGNAVLFIDGQSMAYIISTANFKERNIESAENEVVIKGPKEAFSEGAQTNISLIRKAIRTESLVFESIVISERSNNEVIIVYLKDLANEQLVSEIRNRLNKINQDTIQNLAVLEQHIEERQMSIFPSILYTERPDRAISFIEDGFIVLLMDNSPDALVLPANFWSVFHTSEDRYLRFIDANFTRLLRVFALFITLFTSALYVAVSDFHPDMVPPDLLLAMIATREKVPFPPFFEILIMETSFELIREAGLRVPAPIGPTIGIVGALILGQAAVQANIVSPLVVIAVALGGLSSFAIGDMSLNFAVRFIRFFLIAAAALFGIYGIIILLTMGMFYLVSLTSFGVPYFAPYTPSYTAPKDTIFRNLLTNRFFRPGYLKPKDITKK